MTGQAWQNRRYCSWELRNENRLWNKLLGLFLIFVAWLSITLLSTYPGEQYPWVKYGEAASKQWIAQNFDEWDRQAKLVFAESGKYGGKMPPPDAAEQD